MAYFAAAVARTDDGWVASELDLSGAEDLDGIADLAREVAGPASTALVFVEEDDEWLGIVRVEGDADPRVFISDSRAVETSALARLLYEEAGAPPPGDDDDEEESLRPAADPAGDVDLLADLGTPPGALLDLVAEEGQLPADVMTLLCERAGCLEQLEELRGG